MEMDVQHVTTHVPNVLEIQDGTVLLATQIVSLSVTGKDVGSKSSVKTIWLDVWIAIFIMIVLNALKNTSCTLKIQELLIDVITVQKVLSIIQIKLILFAYKYVVIR